VYDFNVHQCALSASNRIRYNIYYIARAYTYTEKNVRLKRIDEPEDLIKKFIHFQSEFQLNQSDIFPDICISKN